MVEKRVEMKTYIVKAICEKCNGEYIYNGTVETIYPAKYNHTCNKCGNVKALDCYYPRTKYVEVEE